MEGGGAGGGGEGGGGGGGMEIERGWERLYGERGYNGGREKDREMEVCMGGMQNFLEIGIYDFKY